MITTAEFQSMDILSHRLLNLVQDVAIITSMSEGRILYANDAAVQFAGITRDEVINVMTGRLPPARPKGPAQ